MEILTTALQMLNKYPLCDHCLGRQFALLGHSMENRDRGRTIKLLLTLEGHLLTYSIDEEGFSLLKAVAANGSFEKARDVLRHFNKRTRVKKRCFLCEGAFERTPSTVVNAVRKLGRYEFTTLLVGVELPLEVAEREDEFKARFNVTHGESMKSQFSRDVGKQLCQTIKKEVDYSTPDVVVLVNPFADQVRLQINPIHVGGRYKKLIRGIPQSKWRCRRCDGKGCEVCSWTGKTYQDSVEELIGLPLLKMVQGEEMAFHGAGREDVDARMLGSGRPFVLEIKQPKKRYIELRELEKIINKQADGKIEVLDLHVANKEVVRRLKRAELTEKTYRTIVEFGRDVSDKELENIEEILSEAIIRQRTPRRVLHRRSDLTREKYIYKANTKRMSHNRVEMQIRCQGGLYIKELITGDDGRTNPSVASILEVKATPLQLDVLKVGET